MENQNHEFETEIRATGERIFQMMEEDDKSLFNKDWWYGRIMDWSMKNEKFKVQMFRFVDVLPYLNSSDEVAKHLKEYFADLGEDSSGILSFGLGIGALAPGLMAGAIRKNITQMARMFITGESPKDALQYLRKARENSLAFTVDLLGEATLSEKEALEYQSRYIELASDLAKDAEGWAHNPLTDEDDRNPIPKVNVSVKLTSLYSQVNERAWDESVRILKDRVRPIFSMAKDRGAFVNLDMEQYKFKDMTLQVFRELVSEPEFKNYPHFGIVIQAYLRDSLEDTKALCRFARERGTPFTVRLVKGAYWDFETIHADQNGWPNPVYTIKRESDANFEKCADVLLENCPHIRLAAGTHNVRSMAAIMVMAKRRKLDPRSFEIQMLYGMADPIKKALVKSGYRVREYATIGELIPGMAYLVRRLLENTSNSSFLRSKFADNVATEALLRNPAEGLTPSSDRLPVNSRRFYNEPMIDWTKPQAREQMARALASLRKELPKKVRPVINGKSVSSGTVLNRENPSRSNEIVGQVEMASVRDAETAMQGAKEAFEKWRNESAETRAQYLLKIADIFKRDRYRLIATQVLEVGKNWAEADADVAEAIDFLVYYANEMKRIGTPDRVSFVLGEDSKHSYHPRGVSLVISPWNFPLAIITGQVAASIVTGNTCIMKPAEQSSVVASGLMDAIVEAGLPKGVVQFVPGYGEDVGRYLVAHKDTAIISFTGSMAVGLEIVKQTSVLQPGQYQVKKPIIEMGGKNAIIIDSDADLDEAVMGVLYSAFGFQGQKCSACSRVIVHEEAYDRFLPRLIEATRSVLQGDSETPTFFMGPVVDKDAFERIRATIESAKGKSKLAYQGEWKSGGYFVPPTIFADVDPNSELAQEEIFGPVLAVIRVKDLDEALRVANGVKYALTGGVYSRSPNNIELVRRNFACGNLYINRGITGAMVGRHPFGGFKMSGLGSKTGGKDYLLHYLEPRVVTENTMRRGFAPDMDFSSGQE